MHLKLMLTCRMKDQHTEFILEDAGLFISMERPYIGASPDAIVTCECCGKGTVEVKCPFCFKDGFPEDDNPSNFCMTKESSGIAITIYMKLLAS